MKKSIVGLFLILLLLVGCDARPAEIEIPTMPPTEAQTEAETEPPTEATTAPATAEQTEAATEETTQAPTEAETETPTENTRETPAEAVGSEAQKYVVNTNTGKFHKPTCASVPTIKEKNRSDRTCSREELIGAGYQPCKRCNP